MDERDIVNSKCQPIIGFYGLFDQAAQEFVEFRTCQNEQLFMRDVVTIFRYRKKQREQNDKLQPSVYDTQLDYPNQFEWYLIANVNAVTGEIFSNGKKLVMNLGSIESDT